VAEPIFASVSVRCKTPGCPSIVFSGDFVYDSVKWKEDFKNQSIKCDICKTTHTYSSEDVITTPLETPPEA
jgi:hypothetical protein